MKRSKFSPRRKLLFAVIGVLLLLLAYLHFTGAAITQGISTRDMDWNGDGKASETEIMQALYAVVVEKSQQGQRSCSTYRWRGNRQIIRLDCRIEMAATPALK